MKRYTEAELKQMSPLALAYIGDCVYELTVRRHLVDHGLVKVSDLHKSAVQYVNAERQSRLYGEIENRLSETEKEVFRHGRNAKSGHQPPHASAAVYRRATGMEALIGWLHLSGQDQRLKELLSCLFAE
ncbi:MAG: ribonuclease III [Firmicutes bacterium]|nr:ribonuclease III [Bacillota bacterium]